MYIYIYMYIYMFIYVYIYTYMHVYICMYCTYRTYVAKPQTPNPTGDHARDNNQPGHFVHLPHPLRK